MVAGAFVSCCGDTCYYLYAASNEEGRQVNASYALQWHILNYLRNQGVLWYDLGGAAGSMGLRHFKAGLVGKMGRTVAWPGEFLFAPSLRTGVLARTVLATRRRLTPSDKH